MRLLLNEMLKLRDISIKNKLILIQVITSVTVLVLASLAFLFNDIRTFKDYHLKNLISIAQVIGNSSISDILFLDPESSKERLSDLQVEQDILNAAIILPNGKSFATYNKPGVQAYAFKPPYKEVSLDVTDNIATVYYSIVQGGKTLGYTCLRAEITMINLMIRQKITIALIFLFLGFGMALLIGSALQNYISLPIKGLVKVMNDISETGNYERKVPVEGEDEVGKMTQVFNRMLEQIKTRDFSLSAQNLLLKSILNNIRDGVVVTDLSAFPVMLNPAAEEMLEIEPSHMKDQNWPLMLGFHKPDKTPFKLTEFPLNRSLTGATIEKAEVVMLRNHTVKKWFLVSSTPLMDNNGKCSGVVAIFSDITKLKEIHLGLEEIVEDRTKELRSANQNLVKEIEKRKTVESELEKRAVDLERSNAELQQFAYVASHDLQEPLRMISSFTQLLENRYKEKLGAEADEFIYFIVDGAARMKRLIEDLLSFSRVSSRAKPFAICDLNRVLDSVLLNLREAIQQVSGKINIVGKMPVIMADEIQMIQLFQNIIANGLKFQPPQQAPEITIEAKEKGDFWLFSVADNGIGIDKQYGDKVFMIFQRLHEQKKYSGSGIGLSICKKIVERHKGEIWFESEPGQGTTFYFTLPMKLSN